MLRLSTTISIPFSTWVFRFQIGMGLQISLKPFYFLSFSVHVLQLISKLLI